LTSGEFQPAEGKEPNRLRLVNDSPGPRLFPLHEFVPPTISLNSYVIRGRVKYDGVQGVGFLEMRSHFPEQGAYFSRTLGTGGPMGRLTGTSGWRDFSLPFDKADLAGPEKLVLNLHLEGPGTVEIADLELWSPADELSVAGAWWPDRTGGVIGGLGGAILGTFLGGVLAPLMALGKARRFVTASFVLVGAVCVVVLLLGIVAVASGQPYGVSYPLLLLGGLGTFFSVFGWRMAGRKYHEAELRRMTALDVAG
jgi:hypothetical protein